MARGQIVREIGPIRAARLQPAHELRRKHLVFPHVLAEPELKKHRGDPDFLEGFLVVKKRQREQRSRELKQTIRTTQFRPRPFLPLLLETRREQERQHVAEGENGPDQVGNAHIVPRQLDHSQLAIRANSRPQSHLAQLHTAVALLPRGQQPRVQRREHVQRRGNVETRRIDGQNLDFPRGKRRKPLFRRLPRLRFHRFPGFPGFSVRRMERGVAGEGFEGEGRCEMNESQGCAERIKSERAVEILRSEEAIKAEGGEREREKARSLLPLEQIRRHVQRNARTGQ